MNIQDRLRGIASEIRDAVLELRVIDEQIAFQSGVADDARIRALVSETPLADRESAEASSDLLRMQRSRDELARHLDGLRAEQDRLLDALGNSAKP